MKRRFISTKVTVQFIALASIALIAMVAIFSPPRANAQQSEPAPAEKARWESKLEALQPAQPMKYFELAEDIADAGETDAERELAKYLFGLAGALDPERLGRSAALALADLEANDSVKRRLLALATLLGGGGASGSNNSSWSDAPPSGEAVLNVCEALSLYRRGRGPQALSKLEDPGASALIRQYGDLLPGGYNQFVQDCRIYRGDLRPILSDGELSRMLRLEEALLAGDQRNWSSDLLVTKASPLIEIDPTRVAETLKVNPEYCIYRGGKWVKVQ